MGNKIPLTATFNQIWKFNELAGLIDKGYSDERECAFPIEEALEGFDLVRLTNYFNVFYDESMALDPKDMSRKIIEKSDIGKIEDVDRLDKHLDIIIYSLGSIAKLGLTPVQFADALSIVASKNMEKLMVGQDEAGKQMKPIGFVGPEEELQKILDKRKGK